MDSDDKKHTVELKKEDLQKLLSKELGSGFKIKNFTTKPLTNPGDNYGSTILAVNVFYYNNENNNLHELPIVAKLVPESPFLLKVFNIEITFNKEVRAYTLVSPEFHKLQKEKGIPESEMLDIFPKYYGSRSNKQDDINMEADDSAVLLMENLKLSGYEVRDRRKGFNLEHMEFTLAKLAQFHALGVALKLLKPQVFKDTILKTCEKFRLSNPDDDDANEKWVTGNVGHVKHIPEIIPYIEKIEKFMRDNVKLRKESKAHAIREPFATIVHNDFWINNMMFKYDESSNQADEKKSRPTGIKFVDFQVTIYTSPLRDVIFLLFSSSEDGLLEKHFDHLLRLYHKEFTEFLEKLGCDTEPFSFEHFMEEVNICAPQEFSHILFMLNPICAAPTEIEETSNVTQENLLKNLGGELYEKKAKTFIQIFAANGWL